MNIRTALLRVYWLLRSQFGIDPRTTLRSLVGLPRYVRDSFRFRSGYRHPMSLGRKMFWVTNLELEVSRDTFGDI